MGVAQPGTGTEGVDLAGVSKGVYTTELAIAFPMDSGARDCMLGIMLPCCASTTPGSMLEGIDCCECAGASTSWRDDGGG